jgi:hypothetical protein
MLRRRVAVVVCLVAVAAPGQAFASASMLPSPTELASLAAERSTYGLPADLETVSRVLEVRSDEAWTNWGMLLTPDELRALICLVALPSKGQLESA